MYFCDFPIIGDERKLPVYLISVGLNEWQYHVNRKHGYPHHQIIYCTKGSGTLVIDGEKYQIGPKMGFVLPKNHAHEYFTDEYIWDTHWVTFDGFAADEMLKHFGLEKPAIFTLADIKCLERLFRRMHESIISDKISGCYKASGELYGFLIELHNIINSKNNATLSINPALIKAIDYINNHYREKITMEQLCEASGVTKQYLCRLFRNELNTRPMEYVVKRKIQASKELLQNSDKSIEDIAEEVGFCSSSYYNKVFKRYESITASKFRKG